MRKTPKLFSRNSVDWLLRSLGDELDRPAPGKAFAAGRIGRGDSTKEGGTVANSRGGVKDLWEATEEGELASGVGVKNGIDVFLSRAAKGVGIGVIEESE